ncbi:MAG: hypothetical protein QOJ29_699 [Thermoleophilaceae bacterium]|nr:hypothetical protein [Thermoleophilaceae bacterium]
MSKHRNIPCVTSTIGGLTVALACALGVHVAGARPLVLAPVKQATIDTELHRFVAAHKSFPGAAVTIVSPHGRTSAAAGRVKADDGLRIASVTKTFTAAAVLRLAQEHKITLDASAAEYLAPDTVSTLRQGGYDPDAITVRNLLQHTSGLYDYAADPAYQEAVVTSPRHRWTRAEQVGFAMTHGQPLAPPGAEFHYSDSGYVLLGEIIERVTGQSPAQGYRALLGFDRLGLRRTYLESLEPRPANAKSRAHQYLGDVDATGFDPSFDLYGGGGLVSTVGDLATFYRALLHGGVLAPATLKTMLGQPDGRTVADLGMGIFGERVAGETCWSHAGFWGTLVAHCPRSNVTIAITVNQAEGSDRPLQQLEADLLRIARRR